MSTHYSLRTLRRIHVHANQRARVFVTDLIMRVNLARSLN